MKLMRLVAGRFYLVTTPYKYISSDASMLLNIQKSLFSLRVKEHPTATPSLNNHRRQFHKQSVKVVGNFV